ncbi:hypothetical protein [Sphingomonas sp.]|uniref:hypothetical protein n=1 Tax=Sphingomonas sp. TaxID=28214 RepID=UPI003CC611F8
MFRKSLALIAAALVGSAASWAGAQEVYDHDVVVTGARSNAVGWQVATSRHFVVYMRDTPQHVGQYAAKLEHFDKAIRVLHGTPEDNRGAASRVTVFMLDSVDEVQRIAHNDRIAGYYEPNIHAVAFMPRNTGEGRDFGFTSQAVMFHEYTHHWMLTNWVDAAFPAWYTEGNAELHATAIFRSDGSVTFGAVPTYRQNSMDSGVVPASMLLRGRVDRLDERQAATLYGRGWLLTHYLTFDPARRNELAAYVAAVNSGKTIDEAAAVLGDVGSLDGRMNAYGRRAQLPSLTMPADQLQIDRVAVRALSAAEAAAMPALIRSKSGVGKTTAPQVLAMAQQAANAFPNDAATLNELAEAEYDVASTGAEANAVPGLQRAMAAADRAIAVDPHSVHALLYRGMAEQGVAEAQHKTDDPTWRSVRSWFIRANRADTEDPEPLLTYYESFRVPHQTPSAGALNGVIYAYALAPHSLDARFDATKVLLTQGKLREARAAIAPIAYRADLGDQGKNFLKVLTAIDGGNAAAALAAITEIETKADADRAKARNHA